MLLQAYNLPLIRDKDKCILTTASAAAASTLTVDNTSNFALGDYLLLGNFGEPTSEIVRIHATTTLTTTGITLAANTVFAHSAGITITKLDFNQVEFYRAETLTGTKTLLVTKDIVADEEYTSYTDGNNVTGYAFFRFKSASYVSEYSEGIPYVASDITNDTIRSIADSALKTAKEKEGVSIKYEDFIDYTEDFYQELFNYKRDWKFFRKIDQTQSTVSGTNYITLPNDVDSIDCIKIGNNKPLDYISIKRFEELTLASINGTPVYYHIVDRTVYLYPTPNTTETAKIIHFKQPTLPTSVDDIIDVNRTFKYLLKIYFVFRIYDQIGNKQAKTNSWETKFYTLMQTMGSKENQDTIGEIEKIEITNDMMYDDNDLEQLEY